jgi:hypothetical protein
MNPTSIVAPVLGATQIVVKPPSGGAAAPSTASVPAQAAVSQPDPVPPTMPAETATASGPSASVTAPGSAQPVQPRNGDTGAEPAAATTKAPSAVGSKSIPGAKASVGEPLVGSASDTVVFQRIDLVYVEDGDGDREGTSR